MAKKKAAKKKKKSVVKPDERLSFSERKKIARQMVNDSKRKGDGRLGFASDIPDVDYVSTGIEALDQLTGSYSEGDQPTYLGFGGIPRGRYVILWGPQGVGKSTLCDRIIANAQRQNLLAMLIDAENRRTKPWMRRQGIDLNSLIWHRGGILEDSLQDLINLLQVVDFIAVDTLHALAPKAELWDANKVERQMTDDAPLGRQAFGLGKFFRIATARVAKAGVGCLLIGQARNLISTTKAALTCVGGHALQHYATHRIRVSRLMSKEKVPRKNVYSPDGRREQVPVGFVQKLLLEKSGTNHLEGRAVEVPFLNNRGPDDFKSNLMTAVAMGVIKAAGAWFEIPTSSGEPIRVQGRAKLLEFMNDNQEYYEWIMAKIGESYKPEVEEQHEPEEVPDAEEV